MEFEEHRHTAITATLTFNINISCIDIIKIHYNFKQYIYMQTTKLPPSLSRKNGISHPTSTFALVLLAFFAGVNNGYNFYIGATLVSLFRGENLLNSAFQESFMNSSITFGCVFGCFVGGYMADANGRKFAVIVGEIIVICSIIGQLVENITIIFVVSSYFRLWTWHLLINETNVYSRAKQ